MMALGGCREQGAEPLLPSLPFPSLPGCSLPVALARSQGCRVLAWGPSPAQPAPSPHPWEAREPVLPLRCGPWPGGRRALRCQLGCSRCCWRGKGSSAREGKASRGGWQHQHPFWGLPFLHRGFPDLFSCWCLESQGFSLQNRLGAGAAVPASHAPAQPSLPHTLPLPREPTSFLPSAPFPGSKLPPLPVLQTLFSSEIRSSPAALYESHRRQKEAERKGLVWPGQRLMFHETPLQKRAMSFFPESLLGSLGNN